jgi:phage gp29-like protein
VKLWLNEREFVDIDAREKRSLSEEIASRARSIDFWGIGTYLPDPDPVLRKTGQDVRVYEELLSDPHVSSCYGSRKGGTLSCEWQVDYPAPEGSKEPDARVVDLFEPWFEEMPVHTIVSQILEAPFFGFSALEVMWAHKDGRWLPEAVVGKPNEWFVFDNDNRLRFLSSTSQLEGELLPARKFLLAQHSASYKNPYGMRILSRCFWPVAFKKGGFKFWVIFTEKYGIPWAVGKVPRGTQQNERQALLTSLQQMVQDAVAVINDDESVDIQETIGKGVTADLFNDLIKTSNAEISKAILGQTLTTEVGDKGSYAATLGHLEVRQDLVDQDKKLVAQTMNTLFRWVAELNLPDAPPPTFRFYEEERIDRDRAERDEILGRQGVKFRPAYFQRAYNLQEEDFEVGEPAPAEPGGPGGGRLFSERRFAEGRVEGQTAIDELVERLAGRRDAVDPLLQPVLDRINGATSFEEILESIYELYPRMDTSRMEELLRQALFAADLWGYMRAREES